MELLSENDQCKTREEQMYWKHFHTMHFYQVLPNDFHDRLVLPRKFSERMSSKVPNKVSITGPSGDTWDVDVSKTDTLALIGDGWKDFAKTYNLEENFLMNFEYELNLGFKVLIFDQNDLCEKESSYFVKKVSPKPNIRNDKKRIVDEAASSEMMEEFVVSKKSKKGLSEQGRHKSNPKDSRESPVDSFLEDSRDDPEFTPSDKAIDDDDDNVVEVMISLGEKSCYQGLKSCVLNEVAVQDEGGSCNSSKSRGKFATMNPSENNTAGKLIEPNEKEQNPTNTVEKQLYENVILSAGDNRNVFSDVLSAEVMNNGENTPRSNNKILKSDGKMRGSLKRALPKSVGKKTTRKYTSRCGPKRLPNEYSSNRRPVTAKEMENALKLANEAYTEGSFIVIMRPTCVYKRFYMNIPSDWMHKNLPRRHQEVRLRVGEKTWLTTFYYDNKRTAAGGLSTAGWRNFVLENNLEEFDVCLFTPSSEKHDASLVLDVKIFRVVEEITPLTPIVSSI